jgi:prepilin-type N-terminal cleavage/methylation domain-containing protein
MIHSGRRAFTLTELLIVVVILAVIIAFLMFALSRVRRAALAVKLSKEAEYGRQIAQDSSASMAVAERPQPAAPRRRASVKTFHADVVLTPKLSVGTAEPESIYEARFNGQIKAVRPSDEAGECELELPLPPAVISLADLSVTAAGEPSERVSLRDGKLVWRGALAADPTELTIAYSAVGKGMYELSVPPGGILDHFHISLTVNRSDVRLMELSLQPSEPVRSAGATTYTWDYKRLLLGQPVRLDVLGIAPIDRLGELTWLGPVSVVVFGLLVGLFAHAFEVARFDRWMLLLTVGTFAGAYPLMYYTQDFVSLGGAVLTSVGIVLVIIGVRAVTIMGLWLGLSGVVLPAAMILAVTLVATVWPHLQGILLTAEALGFFIVAMMLIPRLRVASLLPTTGLSAQAH